MSLNLLPLLLGLSAAASYGVADFFGAQVSKKLGPVTSAFCVTIVGTVAFAAWYLLFYHAMPHLTWPVLAATIGSGILIGLGTVTLYMAFEIGPVSLASPLGAAYPLVA
ncbi:MAG TPA: EamA family transporter, partial [Candidatus Saccharimonas sp.]|nr:EamA family transporter [Candidatus Saccharimonas sp.]